MRYVDAGYIAALSVLFLYGASLVFRHRRLEGPRNRPGSGDQP
jgi:hypothetical protein